MSPPVRTLRPSAETARPQTIRLCPSILPTCRPVSRSRRRPRNPSRPTMYRLRAGGVSESTVGREGHAEGPVRMSAKLADTAPTRDPRVGSPGPHRLRGARRPSGEKATENTIPACPTKRRITRPLSRSHKINVRSEEPDRICRPSGETTTVRRRRCGHGAERPRQI